MAANLVFDPPISILRNGIYQKSTWYFHAKALCGISLVKMFVPYLYISLPALFKCTFLSSRSFESGQCLTACISEKDKRGLRNYE